MSKLWEVISIPHQVYSFMYRSSPFNYGYSASSSVRAASQIKPLKPTNYSTLKAPPLMNIYQSSTLGGASSKYDLPSMLSGSSDPDKPKGLVNLRNTCYINSVLQLLFEVLQLPVTAYSKPLTKAYMTLKSNPSITDYKDFKKQAEKKMAFIKGDDQQDAQEFLRGLLEFLNQENKEDGNDKKKLNLNIDQKLTVRDNWIQFCKEMKKNDNSDIVNLFGGETHIELRCPQGHSKYSFERFMDLSLHFPEKDKVYNLREFIKSYFREEIIDGVECETCKEKKKCSRKVSFYNLPKILVLHINRFHQGYYSHIKIRTDIVYDEILEIPETALHTDIKKSKPKYKLVGLINHIGSLNAGHYYAVKKGKGTQSNNWFICNDQIIKDARIHPTDNQSQNAYILFYRKIA